MAKLSNQSTNGTSFHSDTITCSLNDLIAIIGKPVRCFDDKVNFEWTCETDKGDVFTIYDWKEYRSIPENQNIEWHIGGHNKGVTYQAKIELNDMLYLATKEGKI